MVRHICQRTYPIDMAQFCTSFKVNPKNASRSYVSRYNLSFLHDINNNSSMEYNRTPVFFNYLMNWCVWINKMNKKLLNIWECKKCKLSMFFITLVQMIKLPIQHCKRTKSIWTIYSIFVICFPSLRYCFLQTIRALLKRTRDCKMIKSTCWMVKYSFRRIHLKHGSKSFW